MNTSTSVSTNKNTPHIPLNAERLKQARQACGLTLEEVALQVSINKMTLQRYESGDIRTIAPERLQRLAALYDTTPANLWGADPEQEYMTAQGILITPISADPPSHLGKRLLTCVQTAKNLSL